MRPNHTQRCRLLNDFKVHSEPAIKAGRQLARGVPDRLFPVEDAPIARGMTEEMLWPLGDEVPTQMTEAKKIGLLIRVDARTIGIGGG